MLGYTDVSSFCKWSSGYNADGGKHLEIKQEERGEARETDYWNAALDSSREPE